MMLLSWVSEMEEQMMEEGASSGMRHDYHSTLEDPMVTKQDGKDCFLQLNQKSFFHKIVPKDPKMILLLLLFLQLT